MGLLDYVRMLRARWFIVVGGVVLGALMAFGWASLQPSVYTAVGSAVVTAGLPEDLEQAEIGDRYAKSRVSSYLDVAASRKVGEYAAGALDLGDSPDALVSRVTVTNPDGTATLRVTATGPTPEGARDLVEAWIAGTAAVMVDIETGGDAARGEPVVRLETLDNAELPSSPTSPDVSRAVVLGAFAGLVLGTGIALVWGALDRRLRRRQDVERNFTLPVLGTIPLDRSVTRAGVSRGGNHFAMNEALRALRTNLQFIDIDSPPRVIVVTSALPGDGKSTISYKLADVLAALGREVILIDSDLRRPLLADYLGIEGGVGLTDVLLGRATVDDVLQPYGETGHLSVMPAGQVPPNPSELVASDAMQSLLYSFPKDTIVLVDTPPLVPVTDAAVLAARTDGALVVARAGKTTVDVLDRALANLDRVGGRPFGVILNGVSLTGANKEGYMHDYGAGVYALPTEPDLESDRSDQDPEDGVAESDDLSAMDELSGIEELSDLEDQSEVEPAPKTKPKSTAKDKVTSKLKGKRQQEPEPELEPEIDPELEVDDPMEPESDEPSDPESDEPMDEELYEPASSGPDAR